MSLRYYMRAYKHTVPKQYVFWTVIGGPDTTGASSGYSPSSLSSISVNNIFDDGYGSGTLFNNISISNVDSPYFPSITSGINILNVDSSGGAIIITLPASPIIGSSIIIKDIMGTSETNSITIQGNGKTIDGNSDVILALNESSIWIQFNSEWIII